MILIDSKISSDMVAKSYSGRRFQGPTRRLLALMTRFALTDLKDPYFHS
jgi:hypothetical protein